ncbi:MAG: tail fiber protein, partial [Magnetospirillum sp.]
YAGTIIAWSGGLLQIPTGWLLCNGRGYDPKVNPNLFTVIGTRFGGTDTNPLVPNLVGSFPMGSDPDNAFPLGKSAGATQIVFKDNQFPPHVHAVVQTVMPPVADLIFSAGIPYNASDTTATMAIPNKDTVLGTAFVNRKGAKVPANIYSTQKQSVVNVSLGVNSLNVTFTPTTPSMTVGAPIAPSGGEDAFDQPVPRTPSCIPYYQSTYFIICAAGSVPPFPTSTPS